MNKPVVLHIATDFPDGLGGDSTKAVANLLNETQQGLTHRVVSVHRLKKPLWKLDDSDPSLLRLQFFSPPKGLFSNVVMLLVSLWLFRRLRHTRIDLIHAHKLTTDGPLGYFLSLWISCPLVLSVRGDTDVRFVRYKPFSRWLFRRILISARHVFWVSGWAKKPLFRLLGLVGEDSIGESLSSNSESLLPNIVRVEPLNRNVADQAPQPARFVFVGKLSQAEKKGLWRVLDSLSMMENAELHIYGRGTDAEQSELRRHITQCGLDRRVQYLGAVSQPVLSSRMASYTALVMPSRDETFGMVYVEALLNGLPVVSCSQSGIDGYLSTQKRYLMHVAVNDQPALIDAMTRMSHDRQSIGQELLDDLSSGELTMFNTERIASHYQQTLLSLNPG